MKDAERLAEDAYIQGAESLREMMVGDIRMRDDDFDRIKTDIPYLADDENVFNGIPAVAVGSIDWGDFDRDGDQDFAVMGSSALFGPIAKIYRNNNGVFQDINAGLDGRISGQVKWTDYNKDGYIDLLVTTITSQNNHPNEKNKMSSNLLYINNHSKI